MRRARRWRRSFTTAPVAIALLGVALLLVATTVSWRAFVRPADVATWTSERYDAIVMFGGAGERFERAVELAEAGVAPTLVISDPRDDTSPTTTPYMVFCAGDHPFEAICFDPDPETTRGESRFVARLAAERGWTSVAVVTTVDQATRARMLLHRCYAGDIDVVAVATDQSRALRLVYEWGATARAVLQRRGC